MAGAFGGLLAGVITEYMDGVGSTPGWQWLFIIEGLGTVVIAVVAVFILPGESIVPRVRLSDFFRDLIIGSFTGRLSDYNPMVDRAREEACRGETRCATRRGRTPRS
jgi:MFS family permease